MTWTYTDPNVDNVSMVRFLVGDTDRNEQLVSDEEIRSVLSTYTSILLAASKVAYAISAKFAREADKTLGDISIRLTQKSERYLDIARELERQYMYNKRGNTAYVNIPEISKTSDSENYPSIYQFVDKTTSEIWTKSE